MEDKNFVNRAIGKRLDELIERVRKAFYDKYKIELNIIDASNMIADAVNKKGLTLF